MQIANKQKIVYPELSYEVCGILFKTHNDLGRFCNEKQYGDAVEQLLIEHNIKYEREKRLPTFFVGEQDGRSIVDFLIEGKILLELKTKRMVSKEDYYQVSS